MKQEFYLILALVGLSAVPNAATARPYDNLPQVQSGGFQIIQPSPPNFQRPNAYEEGVDISRRRIHEDQMMEEEQRLMEEQRRYYENMNSGYGR